MTIADGICECCAKKKPLVGVAGIPGLPMSITWCGDCLNAQVIPYWACIHFLAMTNGDLTGLIPECQEMITDSLKYHGKTMDELMLDVKSGSDPQELI